MKWLLLSAIFVFIFQIVLRCWLLKCSTDDTDLNRQWADSMFDSTDIYGWIIRQLSILINWVNVTWDWIIVEEISKLFWPFSQFWNRVSLIYFLCDHVHRKNWIIHPCKINIGSVHVAKFTKQKIIVICRRWLTWERVSELCNIYIVAMHGWSWKMEQPNQL